MAKKTLTVDIIDKSVPSLNPINIAIINKPNPVQGEAVTGRDLLQLIQFPKYWITETSTGTVVSGNNIYDYFPELKPGGGGGGGGDVTRAEVEQMIASSIDPRTSLTSTNSIQNKAITKYVDDSTAGAIDGEKYIVHNV